MHTKCVDVTATAGKNYKNLQFASARTDMDASTNQLLSCHRACMTRLAKSSRFADKKAKHTQPVQTPHTGVARCLKRAVLESCKQVQVLTKSAVENKHTAVRPRKDDAMMSPLTTSWQTLQQVQLYPPKWQLG